MILSVVTLIIQLLPGILQSAGVISPAISDLITKLGAAVPGLITALAQGKSVPDDVIDILKAFQSELATLKQETSLSAHALGMISTLTLSIANALAQYELAQKTDDPSTLTDLATDLENDPNLAAFGKFMMETSGGFHATDQDWTMVGRDASGFPVPKGSPDDVTATH